MRKGQATTIDLFASISIFIVLVAFILFYWVYATNRLNKDLNYEDTQLRALRIADLLAKTPGEPSRWEVIPNSSTITDDISSLGFGTTDRIFSDQKVTNFSQKLSYDDIKKILNIEGYDFNFSIKRRDNITALLKKFDIRVAYIRVGSHCSDNANRLSQVLNCGNVVIPFSENTRQLCEVYTNSNDLDEFINRINDYDLVVWEEPAGTNNPFDDPIKTKKVEDWLANSTQGFNVLMMVGKIKSSGSNNLLNVTWTAGGGSQIKNATKDYYEARDTREERFVVFPPDCTPDDPEIDQCKIKPWSASIDGHYVTPKNTRNYLAIAEDKANLQDAISRWQIGSGYVYYFSGICKKDNYNANVFDRLVYSEELVVIELSKQLYAISITKGIPVPPKADVVTIQRDIMFQNSTALMEFSLWKRV